MIVKSPLTDSCDTKLIRKIEVDDLINAWKSTFGIDITNEMKGHQFIYEYYCNSTNLSFFIPDDVDGSGKFYEELQKFDWYYMSEKWEHKMSLKRLKQASKVLEVGCGEGDFINLCNKYGHEATGLELNNSAVVKAREKGLVVYEKNLHQLSYEKLNYYDLVCSYQVLEQINKPKEFINSCIRLIKPGGRLIFCVPNSDGFLATDYSLLDMPPHHMTRWNKKSFKSLEIFFDITLDCIYYEPLAQYHWQWYTELVAKKIVTNRIFRKAFSLKRVSKIFKWILSLGFNKFIKGHTIYVEFIKNKENVS